MRFDRYQRSAFEWSVRRDKLASQAHAADDNLRDFRAGQAARTYQGIRDNHARAWRRARARYFAVRNRVERRILAAYWNNHRTLPATPSNLEQLLRRFAASGVAGLQGWTGHPPPEAVSGRVEVTAELAHH